MQTSATMTMRIKPGEAATPGADEQQRGEPGPAAAAPVKIAIVEDELIVAWSLQSTAEDLGHEVIGVFASGEAALEILADEPADLLFIDINLGEGIDGIETARRLRDQRPIAVLFVTANADSETRARVAETVPGAMLLRKPVLASLLQQAIAQLSAPRD